MAQQLGVQLGLSDDVTGALFQGFERWDGRGHPHGLRGDAIHLSARIAAAASALVMFEQSLGAADAESILRRWAGHALDPDVVETILAVLSDSGGALNVEDPLPALLAAEPRPALEVPDTRLDDVAAAFAIVGDLKATHLHGHSGSVARVAERAARLRGRADER